MHEAFTKSPSVKDDGTHEELLASYEQWMSDDVDDPISGSMDFAFALSNSLRDLLKQRDELLAACQLLINADHYDHFATRLSYSEMLGIDAIKAAIANAAVKPEQP